MKQCRSYVMLAGPNGLSILIFSVFTCYQNSNHRIYSINRPRRLLNFWTLRVGANSRLGAYWNKYSKQLSIFQSFYFPEVLQHANSFIYSYLLFKRVRNFPIEDALISKPLHDVAFSCCPGKLLCGLKLLPIFLRFCYLNILCLRMNITLIFF